MIELSQITSMLNKLHAKEIAAAEKRASKPVKVLRMEVVSFTPLADVNPHALAEALEN